MSTKNSNLGFALVTGASSGFGELFCRDLAERGYSLIMVARRKDRMTKLASELKTQFQTLSHIFDYDLSREGAAQKLFAETQKLKLHVEILINNAGYGSNGKFTELDFKKESEMISLNCRTLVELCHLYATEMQKKKSGRILNIGSTAGFQPGPLMATYYASKAFVNSFSEALAYELRSTGVTLTLSCPGYTETEFGTAAGLLKSNLAKVSAAPAKGVASDAIKAMLRGERRIIHGALNKIFAGTAGMVPGEVTLAIASKLNSAT
jgi:uncharacterized protein